MGYIDQLINDPALLALLGAVFTAFAADFLTGVFAAIKNGTFKPAYVVEILNGQGTQVAMIVGLAFIAGDLATPLGGMAATAAAAYGIAVQKSVRENFGELLSGGDSIPEAKKPSDTP